MRSNNDKLTKNPYQSPNLFVYGDIREITKATSGGPYYDSITHIPGATNNKSNM